MKEEKAKQILLEHNKRFKELFLSHQELEEQLNELEENFLKSQESDRINAIKITKLNIKDDMQRMICEYKKKVAKNCGG
jgi:uncharacterized protein YdcH (DUF465 family)